MRNRQWGEDNRQKAWNSADGLVKLLAFVVAFLLTPEVFNWTAGWANRFIERNYGADLVDILMFVWFFLIGAFIYNLSKTSFYSVLSVGFLYVAMRLV